MVWVCGSWNSMFAVLYTCYTTSDMRKQRPAESYRGPQNPDRIIMQSVRITDPHNQIQMRRFSSRKTCLIRSLPITLSLTTSRLPEIEDA